MKTTARGIKLPDVSSSKALTKAGILKVCIFFILAMSISSCLYASSGDNIERALNDLSLSQSYRYGAGWVIPANTSAASQDNVAANVALNNTREEKRNEAQAPDNKIVPELKKKKSGGAAKGSDDPKSDTFFNAALDTNATNVPIPEEVRQHIAAIAQTVGGTVTEYGNGLSVIAWETRTSPVPWIPGVVNFYLTVINASGKTLLENYCVISNRSNWYQYSLSVTNAGELTNGNIVLVWSEATLENSIAGPTRNDYFSVIGPSGYPISERYSIGSGSYFYSVANTTLMDLGGGYFALLNNNNWVTPGLRYRGMNSSLYIFNSSSSNPDDFSLYQSFNYAWSSVLTFDLDGNASRVSSGSFIADISALESGVISIDMSGADSSFTNEITELRSAINSQSSNVNPIADPNPYSFENHFNIFGSDIYGGYFGAPSLYADTLLNHYGARPRLGITSLSSEGSLAGDLADRDIRRNYKQMIEGLRNSFSYQMRPRSDTQVMDTIGLDQMQGLQDIVIMLGDKADKSDTDRSILEAAQAVLQNLPDIADQDAKDFTEAVHYIRMAESMRDLLEGVDFVGIKATLQGIVEEQAVAYRDYMGKTGQIYDELAMLLSVNTGDKLPEAYLSLPNINDKAKRKILVDIKLNEAKAKPLEARTDNEKKALSIEGTLLQPYRTAYTQALKEIMSRFVAKIKDALSGAPVVSQSADKDNEEMLLVVDERVKP